MLHTTYAVVRDEIMDVVQARAATGSSPMLVDTLTKAKARARKGKVKARTRRARTWKSKAKYNGAKSQRTALRRSASTATASVT